jgi:hypothetical protein
MGDPVVGSPLTAVIKGSVDPAAVTFKWCRAGAQPGRCAAGRPVGFGPVYVPVAADVGSPLIVTATATIDTFDIQVRSSPTAPVTEPRPPAPNPSPEPTPTATATPEATPGPTPAPDTATPPPVFTSAGSAPAGAVPDPGALPVVAPAAPRFLRPFPVVRIRGYVLARGADVTLLKVAAPPGVRVLLRCEGRSCPVTRRRLRTPGRIRALERFLRAGTRITIRVVRPGFIGKFSQITIRAGRPPSRRDACLMPGSARAVACPSA